jgi:hypothetical protein
MPAQPSIQPPRAASWLISLFAPYEETESIPGDLSEEFCLFAEVHGFQSARRWYWRQTSKSILHLIAAAFRISPLKILGAAMAGLFLLRLGVPLPERIEFAILNWGNIYHSHWHAYISWMNNAEVLTGQLLVCLAVGCVVGLLAKGGELVSAMVLGVSMQLLFFVVLHFARYVGPPETSLQLLIHLAPFPIMLLVGAWIIRDRRLTQLSSRRNEQTSST